ncbi:hypothetical protein [Curtobacterium pusillum]|uniref:hypothetical protein n=1 Tax=Curtobacterium pusillum TaxID=69373 RepID=UPI0011A56969|nr:hypothetical protein [Curtobacterium pusillum]
MPLGIEIFQDGRRHFLNFHEIGEAPIARQLRDAALGVMGDRGGGVKAAATAAAYQDAADYAVKQLLPRLLPEEQPLDIKTLVPATLHSGLFEGRTSPASVRTTLARRLLLDAAEAAKADASVAYLKRLKLHGFSRPSRPYTSEELEAIVGWCKGRLNDLFLRRLSAFRMLDEGASEDSTQGAIEVARQIVALRDHPATVRDWVAWVLVVGPESDRPLSGPYGEAVRLLSPTVLDAQATALLIINEFGAEASVLISMDTVDFERAPDDSSLTRISGLKSRADRAVSRKGNGVSTWSGGRVIERWITATAHLRSWTDTDHLLIWVQSERSDKTLRHPVATAIPQRPIVLEGDSSVVSLPSGGTVRMSTQRMRKTWAARADRVVGGGVRGAIDPNHSARVSWTFYRGAGLSEEERLEIIADGQDEYYASILAVGYIIADSESPEEIRRRLWHEGLSDETIDKVLAEALDDTGTAGCVDPRAVPGQKLGTLCRKTPFACLLCPNAVFTTIHLPIILALADRIDRDREEQVAEVFISTWAGVAARVDQILEAFSQEAVDEAMSDLEAAQERLRVLEEAYGR